MPGMKRFDKIHAASGRLVVPPFGCAWLSDSESQIKDERGCIVFEVAGETDATIILKSRPGSGRWQHFSRHIEGENPREDSYLVIFGSHRNTLLRIERNATEKASFRTSWSNISPSTFHKFWICYVPGIIYIGRGDPSQNYEIKWEDPEPLHGLQHVGLSAWDKHCTFRNVRVQPYIPWLEPRIHGVPTLFDICVTTLLDNLDLRNACFTFLALDRWNIPNLEQLRKRACILLAKRYEDFFKYYLDVIVILSSHALSSLLRSPELSADETLVFNSVVLWMFHGDTHQNRQLMRSSDEISDVLKWVRFSVIDSKQLKDMLSGPLARQSREVFEAIEHGLTIQSHASDLGVNFIQDEAIIRNGQYSQNKRDIDFFWKRALPNSVQLQYSYDGDKNGVTNYLGCECGTKPWKNPMVRKKLTIKASSPNNRFTNPKDVVGDKFLRTNYAGPKRVNSLPITWWLIDLHDKMLFCNYYTVRHDASYDFTRFWDFQGSDDNENWRTLRKHEEDRTINAPGGFGSWPIYCSAKPYRMFRLLLTKPTESLITPYNMSLSSLELYGTLIGHGIS